MKPRILLSSILLACAALAPAQNPFQWNGHLPQGKTLEIRGVNGWIHATPSAGDSVSISAAKTGDRSDPNSVRVEVVEHAGGITVCAVYPTPSDSSQVNECKPGGGHMSTKDNDVKVNFTIAVPDGVLLQARTVNGGIEARGLRGEADITTVNGSVKVSAVGPVRAKTVNGSIYASMDNAWNGERRFETVNGSIDLALPPQIGTELSATTVNGGIHSDFSIATTSLSRRHLKGIINGGGRQLTVKTVNGDIHVRKG